MIVVYRIKDIKHAYHNNAGRVVSSKWYIGAYTYHHKGNSTTYIARFNLQVSITILYLVIIMLVMGPQEGHILGLHFWFYALASYCFTSFAILINVSVIIIMRS